MWARKEDRDCTKQWVVCLPERRLQSENFLSWNALNPPKLERRKRLLLNRQAELRRCISGFSSLSSTSWDLWRHHPAQNIFRKVLSQLWSQSHRFNGQALSAQTGWGAICFPSRTSSATWWLHTVRGGVSMDKAWVEYLLPGLAGAQVNFIIASSGKHRVGCNIRSQHSLEDRRRDRIWGSFLLYSSSKSVSHQSDNAPSLVAIRPSL